MIPDAFSLEFITREAHPNRAVVFLVRKGHSNLARKEFNSLKINAQRTLKTRCDWWVENVPQIKKKWFHGWKQSDYSGRYKECFVFKVKEERLNHRFYGFLINPKLSNPRYQVCILINHTIKKQSETNTTYLDQVIEMRMDPTIIEFIENYFRGLP